MKHIVSNPLYSALVVLGLLCGCAQPKPDAASLLKAKPGPSVFFVATNGNDGWSGRLAAPNTTHTDGPFATPARALEAVRQFQAGQGGIGVNLTFS